MFDNISHYSWLWLDKNTSNKGLFSKIEKIFSLVLAFTTKINENLHFSVPLEDVYNKPGASKPSLYTLNTPVLVFTQVPTQIRIHPYYLILIIMYLNPISGIKPTTPLLDCLYFASKQWANERLPSHTYPCPVWSFGQALQYWTIPTA